MPLCDYQRSGVPITAQYPQHPFASNTGSTQLTGYPQIRPTNLIERTKLNGLIVPGAASIPRRKSPLSISYTPNDDDDSINKDETDLSADYDDVIKANITDCVNKNHPETPLDVTSTSTTDHLQHFSYHGNNTRVQRHVAAEQSPDISTSINCSQDKNNKNNNSTSNHNNVVTHTQFDNTAQPFKNNQITTTMTSLKSERSYRFSWIHHIDKRPSSWIRGFFDKYRRVNDEIAAGNKQPSLPMKPVNQPTKTFPDQTSSSILPPQLTSYLSRKLSIPHLKRTSNSSNRQPYKGHYAKNRRKSKKTTNHQLPKDTGGVVGNDRQQRRQQPILDSDVYRMSHMKLTNPRRSLREQVIIINLMFRYLSTLPMKHQHRRQQQMQQQQQQQQWQILYHTTSSSSETTIKLPSSALKSIPSKNHSLTQSILPHVKHTLTTSTISPSSVHLFNQKYDST